MKRKLVIHIGTPKTGTTSIQNTFGNSKEVLLRQHIYYPAFEQYNHIFNFMPIFKENGESLVFLQREELTESLFNAKFSALKQQWIEQFQTFKHGTFIISAEWLTIFNGEEVKSVKEFVMPYFDEVQIVAYVRPFKPFISSIAQQMVKEGWFSVNDITTYTEGPISPLTYISSIKHWITVFGNPNVSVRYFDRGSFLKGDLLADFLHVIGHSDVDVSTLVQKKTNEALTENTVLMLSKLNEMYPLMKNGQLNKARGLANRLLPRNIYYAMKDEKFKLDVHFTEAEAVILNEAIDYINGLFTTKSEMPYVEASEPEVAPKSIEEVEPAYYTHLLNDYHKEIEKHFINQDFYNSLLDLSQTSKRVFIWGTGSAGEVVYDLSKKASVNVAGFVDSNKAKQGLTINNLHVYSFEQISEQHNIGEYFILVASSYYEDIINTLQQKGLRHTVHFAAKTVYTTV